MHCKSCEMLIGDALTDAGAHKTTLDFKKGTCQVEYDEKLLSEKTIKDLIVKEGYKVK